MEYAPGGSVADLLDDQPSPSRRRLTVEQTVFVGRQTRGCAGRRPCRGHRPPRHQAAEPADRRSTARSSCATSASPPSPHDDEYRTRTNAVSMRYASPEDLEHDDPVGPASDIYSLGATLLHLVHGAPPTLRDRLDAVGTACDRRSRSRRARRSDRRLPRPRPGAPSHGGTSSSSRSTTACSTPADKGVCELPVVDRSVPLITFDDVPIDLHEALTLQPPNRPGEAIELERPLDAAPTEGRRIAPSPRSWPQPPRSPPSCSSWARGRPPCDHDESRSESHRPDHDSPPTRLGPARGSRLVKRFGRRLPRPTHQHHPTQGHRLATPPTTSSATTRAHCPQT